MFRCTVAQLQGECRMFSSIHDRNFAYIECPTRPLPLVKVCLGRVGYIVDLMVHLCFPPVAHYQKPMDSSFPTNSLPSDRPNHVAMVSLVPPSVSGSIPRGWKYYGAEFRPSGCIFDTALTHVWPVVSHPSPAPNSTQSIRMCAHCENNAAMPTRNSACFS